MENFDWTRFTRRIAVKSTIPKLYDAFTKATEIEKWFLAEAEHLDNGKKIPKDIPAESGFDYQWKWFAYDAVENGRYTETNGTDFIQFTFEGDCLVDIRLAQQNDMVIVELTQKNIPTDETSKKNIRLGCHAGWGFYLVNLKSVYEGGLDLRNRDAELAEMINN